MMLFKVLAAFIFLIVVAHAEDVPSDWISVSEASSPSEALKLPRVNRFLEELKAEFMKFKKLFQVSFTSVREEGRRFVIFAENFMRIKRHNEAYNNGKVSYQLGVNKFADRTPEEMKVLRGYRPAKKLLNGVKGASQDLNGSFFMRAAQKQYLPVEVDWREKGAVTPVKDQGQCGSCYAFSTTGSLEGQHFRKTEKLVSLSEQQIVDCSGEYENQGCNGGLMDNAFQYIKANKGIDTEKSYPYTSGSTHKPDKKCLFRKDSIGATDTGFVDLPSGDEEALQEAVANNGPISVAIDASASSFQLYHSGVYTEESCHNKMEDLDHGVLVVGYGVEKGIPYWLVKNSWSSSWGDGGYLKMRRNYKNMCGIATQASYPLV